ncbi:MAG: hypothetical protein ACREUD_06255, partial [Gammaproteobacteria bacterium]
KGPKNRNYLPKLARVSIAPALVRKPNPFRSGTHSWFFLLTHKRRQTPQDLPAKILAMLISARAVESISESSSWPTKAVVDGVKEGGATSFAPSPVAVQCVLAATLRDSI